MESPCSRIAQQHQIITWKHTVLLAYQSLGVLYGHLSIGPLYVFSSISHDDITSEETLFGFLSFIFWTMTLISLVKYVLITLRVDDNGEGGTFALYSLLCKHAKVSLLPLKEVGGEFLAYEEGSFHKNKNNKDNGVAEVNKATHYLMLLMALLGACMVIAHGVLVPVISVFSASLHLNGSIAMIFFKYMSVPTACAILIGLFVLQHYGTHKLSFLFTPIIIVWLLLISGIGVHNIFHWNIHVIYALSPEYMYKYLRNLRIKSWRSLGGILLCVAGSEAVFADLGHFTKKSIKLAFCLVYPCLILCYTGQIAYLSKNLSPSVSNYPPWVLVTCPGHLCHLFAWFSVLASAVGSQATITASFSIINQCLTIGLFPKAKIVHTSKKIYGQVYIPSINWTSMSLSLFFTIFVDDIVSIGSAAGLMTIVGMLITTSFMSLIIALHWEKLLISLCFAAFFGTIESFYILASVLNFQMGASIPVIFVGLIFIVMLAWHYGTIKKYEFDVDNKVSADWLTTLGSGLGIARVLGIGFVHTDIVTGIPAFFSHLITNLPALHQVLIFVSFKSVPLPYVQSSKQYLIGRVGAKEYRVYRCIVRYGYRDNIRDVYDLEDHILHGVMEFVSLDDGSSETSTSRDNMIISGNLDSKSDTLTTVLPSDPTINAADAMDSEPARTEPSCISARRRPVRVLLSQENSSINSSVRAELQALVSAKEHGTTCILGQPHFSVHRGSSFLKRLMIMIYSFLATNLREDSEAMSRHAAYVEVSMLYTI